MAQQLGWPPENTLIAGHSLRVALHALHDQGQIARGAIIMSTFTSLPDMAGVARWLMADRFAGDAGGLGARHHGPAEHGHRLFAALPEATPKAFIAIETAHADRHGVYGGDGRGHGLAPDPRGGLVSGLLLPVAACVQRQAK